MFLSTLSQLFSLSAPADILDVDDETNDLDDDNDADDGVCTEDIVVDVLADDAFMVVTVVVANSSHVIVKFVR
jgi:hypothetical protein